MSTGKHMKRSKFRRSKKTNITGKHMQMTNTRKINEKIISLVILLVCVVATTSAYLIIKNSISNEFIMGKVEPEIIETFKKENKVKEDVYIKNSGNVPIYIKTAIIISWKDKQGKILEVKPVENLDYIINFSTSENWIISNDGYYYYKKPITPNDITDILIEECIQTQEYDDKVLDVNIATQAIQAQPTKAVTESWNVNITDNVLFLKE